MMGSQPSSIFLGIEASCFNFLSLILTRAFVMCSVKAKFWELVWGLSASVCKYLMTSEIVQWLISKSLSSKTRGLCSPTFSKKLIPLSELSSVVLGNFLGGIEAFSLLNILLGGLLTMGISALLVVVMVQTLVISLSLAISSSLSHIACNSAIILTFLSILTWMACKVLLSLESVGITFSFIRSSSRARLSTLVARTSILLNFSSIVLLKAVCLVIKSLSMTSSSEGVILLLLSNNRITPSE